MPEVEVELPNGQVEVFDVPDGTPDEDFQSAVGDFYKTNYSSDYAKENPPEDLANRSVAEEFSQGVQRGSYQTAAIGSGLGYAAASAVGADELANSFMDGYTGLMEKAGEHPAKIASYTDVKSIGDAGMYLVGGIAQLLPDIAGALATGGVGATVGKQVAKKAIAKLGATVTAKEAAKIMAKKQIAGATAGAFAFNTGIETGSIAAEVKTETGEDHVGTALLFGTAAGMLDTALPVRIFKKLGMGKEFADKAGHELVTSGFVGKLAKKAKEKAIDVGKGAAIEGITEGMQTKLEQMALHHAQEKSMWKTSPQEVEEIINGSILGFVAGGGTTALTLSGEPFAGKGERNKPTVDVPPTEPTDRGLSLPLPPTIITPEPKKPKQLGEYSKEALDAEIYISDDSGNIRQATPDEVTKIITNRFDATQAEAEDYINREVLGEGKSWSKDVKAEPTVTEAEIIPEAKQLPEFTQTTQDKKVFVADATTGEMRLATPAEITEGERGRATREQLGTPTPWGDMTVKQRLDTAVKIADRRVENREKVLDMEAGRATASQDATTTPEGGIVKKTAKEKRIEVQKVLETKKYEDGDTKYLVSRLDQPEYEEYVRGLDEHFPEKVEQYLDMNPDNTHISLIKEGENVDLRSVGSKENVTPKETQQVSEWGKPVEAKKSKIKEGKMGKHTVEQLQAARIHAAKIERNIASHAFDEDFGFPPHITDEDKQRYVDENIKAAEDIEAGKMDGNFTVAQRMHQYLTGELVPFLPKPEATKPIEKPIKKPKPAKKPSPKKVAKETSDVVEKGLKPTKEAKLTTEDELESIVKKAREKAGGKLKKWEENVVIEKAVAKLKVEGKVFTKQPSELELRHEKLKEDNPDSIAFVKADDFYYAIGKDAENIAKATDITLETTSQGVRTVGFPVDEKTTHAKTLEKQGMKAVFEDDKDVSEDKPSFMRKATKRNLEPVTKELVQEAFPTAKVLEITGDNGKPMWKLGMPNGTTLTIEPDKIIKMSKADIAREKAKDIAAGRKVIETPTAVGTITVKPDSVMWLSKEAGTEAVNHEGFHLAWQSVLTDKERTELAKKYKDEEGSATAYGRWQPAKMKNKIFQKIYDFFVKLKDTLFPSATATFRKVKSGEVFERTPEFGKRGTFDPTDPRISYMRKPTEEEAKAEPDIEKDPMDKWFNKTDLKKHNIDVRVASIQKRIKAYVGKQPFILRMNKRANYDLAVKRMDAAIQLWIDIMPTSTNPNKPNQMIDKYWDTLSDKQKDIVDEAVKVGKDPELQKIVSDILKEDKATGKEALEAKAITNLIENHLSRFWKPLKGNRLSESKVKFKTTTGLRKGRTFESILEGWSKGRQLAIEGASTALAESQKAVHLAMENKQLIVKLKNTNDADGNVLLSNKKLDNYVQIDNHGFKDWTYGGNIKGLEGEIEATLTGDTLITEDGTIMKNAPLYAPEHFAKELNAIFGSSKLKGVFGFDTATKYNALMKGWVLQSSLFHHLAFTRSYLLGTSGKTLKEWNVRQSYKDGLKMIENENPILDHLVGNGLTLGNLQDWEETMLRRDDTIFGKAMDSLGDTATDVKDKINAMREAQADYLFKKLGAGLKAKAAMIEYRNAVKEFPDMDANERAKMVAKLINEDFGGLHLQRMRRDPTIQHILRLTLLAPDWTESNIKTFYHAIKGGDTKEATKMYRKFWAGIIAKGVVATITLNALLASFDDKDFLERLKIAWGEGDEWKQYKWLDLDITPIAKALGGRENYRYYFPIFGHFKDPVRWVTEFNKVMHHKTSMIGKLVYEGMTSEDWAGRKFTTIEEFLGADMEGEVYTRNTATHNKGELKGGQKQGQIVKYDFGGAEILGASQIPSFLVSQAKSVQPVQVQNLLSFAMGQMDGFKTVTKSMGFRVTSRKVHSPFAEFNNRYKALKQIDSKKDVAENKVAFKSQYKTELREYAKMTNVRKRLSHLKSTINKHRRNRNMPQAEKVAKIKAINLHRLEIIKKAMPDVETKGFLPDEFTDLE